MPACPGPSGPHPTRAEPHPRLLARDRATPALGSEAARARQLGHLHPHAIAPAKRGRALQGGRLAPCEGLSHPRPQPVPGREGAPCPQGPGPRCWQGRETVPPTLAHPLGLPHRPPAVRSARAPVPGQHAVPPAPCGPVHGGPRAVGREPGALIAPTARRRGWAPPGHRCIALHPQRGVRCCFSGRFEAGWPGGEPRGVHREAKVGWEGAWESRTLEHRQGVMQGAAMVQWRGMAQRDIPPWHQVRHNSGAAGCPKRFPFRAIIRILPVCGE